MTACNTIIVLVLDQSHIMIMNQLACTVQLINDKNLFKYLLHTERTD